MWYLPVYRMQVHIRTHDQHSYNDACGSMTNLKCKNHVVLHASFVKTFIKRYLCSCVCSGGSRIFERGVSVSAWQKHQLSLSWRPKKKKVINLHTSLSAAFYMIYNKATVIRASQSDCSIRECRSDCSIRVYEFQKGVSVETLRPPWIRHWCVCMCICVCLFVYLCVCYVCVWVLCVCVCMSERVNECIWLCMNATMPYLQVKNWCMLHR